MGDCKPHFSFYNIGLSLVFVTIFCLSVLGNTVVIVTILYKRHKTARSITNLYLLNLAVADLLRIVVCMPTTLVSELTQCWVLGRLMCKLVAYLQPVGVCASAYTLAVIAVERYYAICRPLHSRKWHTKKRALSLLCLVWLWSFVANIGSLALFDEEKIGSSWSCHPVQSPTVDFFHQLYITMTLLLMPLGLMIALYGNVIYTLNVAINSDQDVLSASMLSNKSLREKDECQVDRNSITDWICKAVKITKSKKVKEMDTLSLPISTGLTPRGGITTHRGSFGRRSIFGILTPRCSLDSNMMVLRSTNQDKILIAKRRVTRMLVTIVILFAACWTPSYIFWLILKFCDLFNVNVWNTGLNTLLTVMTYISSCTNPITYCFMNKSFRHSLLNYCSGKPKRCATPLTFRSQSRVDSPRQVTVPQIKVDFAEMSAIPSQNNNNNGIEEPNNNESHLGTPR